MPSRKKARGRESRAKKEATRTADLRLQWEPTVNKKHLRAIPLQIPREGQAISFMNYLAGEGIFGKATTLSPNEALLMKCIQTVVPFHEFWKEDNERALAVGLLLRYLRNTFVSDSAIKEADWFRQRFRNEVVICCLINILELIGVYSDHSVVVGRATKTGNRLVHGNRRDLVKFVAKRLPCTCLRELHRAARKKVGKVGRCHGCLKDFPRIQLRVCTGCMMAEYCSKECQRTHWSRHKFACGNPELMNRDLPGDYVLDDERERRLHILKRNEH